MVKIDFIYQLSRSDPWTGSGNESSRLGSSKKDPDSTVSGSPTLLVRYGISWGLEGGFSNSVISI
jgi:hypothetical protein